MSLYSTLPSPILYPTHPPLPDFILPSPPLSPSLPYHALYFTQLHFTLPYPAPLHSTTPFPVPCPPVYRTLPRRTPFHYILSSPPPPLSSHLPHHTMLLLHSPFTLTYIYYPSLSYPALLYSTLPSPPLQHTSTFPILPYSTSFNCHTITFSSLLYPTVPYPIPTFLPLPNSTPLNSTLPSPWLSPPLYPPSPILPSRPFTLPYHTLPYSIPLLFTLLYPPLPSPLLFPTPWHSIPPAPIAQLVECPLRGKGRSRVRSRAATYQSHKKWY